jgi:hypothetical protein
LQTRVIKSTDKALQYLKGMEIGWSITLDRLEAHIMKSAKGEKS